MSFWLPENLRALLGGVWLARPRPEMVDTPASGLSIDSRAIKPGQVFLALKGERTDGHLYLEQAATQRPALAIVDSPDLVPPSLVGVSAPMGVLQVSDSAAALIRLAAAYRKTLDTTRVIAVAGSNGKTTTTRLIEAVLSTRFRGTASQKSFNNSVGVPLTILRAKKSDNYLICEVGTNAPGEIATLAGIVQPDLAVITSIGREHLEKLGSLEGVAQEEASLIASLRPGGLAIYNADAPFLGQAIEPMLGSIAGASALRFGRAEHADLRLTTIDLLPTGVRFELNSREVYFLPLLGEHNASNAAAAVGVARRFGLDHADIERGLASAKGPEMRLEPRTVHGIHIINDAYNANPDSAMAAIAAFRAASVKAPRRVGIFGDMLEQGSAAPEVHRELGDAIAAAGCFDVVICFGPLSMYAAERVNKAHTIADVHVFTRGDAADVQAAAALIRSNDAVLLKGSRGMALERIVAHLEANPPAPTTVVLPTSPRTNRPAR